MHAASSSEKHMSTEKTSSEGGAESQLLTKMSSMITESSTTHTTTKKEYISSTMSSTLLKSGEEPSSVCTKTVVQSMEQASSENGGIPVVQSQKVEEYEKIMQDQPGEIRQEKTVIVSHDQEGAKSDSKLTQLQKPSRKFTAPRFVTPITGMIVDQGTDIVLEGMIDGYPQPTIIWSKNGQELKSTDFKTSYAHNHVRLELKNVNVKDAGRYTCTANNEVGSASSTADLVVKKTIFPPVFGRRLQAQVVKRGDRVIMEVEITGMPEPTVLWYKDDIPIKERPPEQRIKQQGNCYTLIIEKAEKEHVGKYMVRATNAGGEAQSIADFAVFEPTPDTMVEVHKTRVYENIQDKKTVQPGVQMEHVPFVNLKTERISTTMIEPSPIAKTIPTSSMSTSTVFGVQKSNEPEMHSYRSEKISSTVESSQIETKSEQKFHMKLEHRTPPIMETKSMQDQSSTVRQILPEDTIVKLPESKDKTFDEKIMTANENVETSTIARKDALSFFESMTRESENLSKGPKEMIRLVDDSDGQAQEMKVGKLTKNYERSTTYQEVKKPETKPQCDFQATKKAVQEIFTKLEQGPSPRGVDNKLFNFPCESYKPSPAESKRTEEATSYRSTMSKSAFESVDTSFNLVPEPPPEIGYMAKPEEAKKKRPEVSIKAKQLQESFEKTLSPIEAPIGGVKIFPSPKVPETTKIYTPSFSIPAPPFELERKEVVEETCIKKDAREKRDSKYLKEEKIRPLSPIRPWSSSSDMETRSHVSTDLSEYRCHSAASSHQEALRATSPRPSADGLAMEKSWAKKCPDSTRKSWPPPAESANTLKEWMVPGEDYKSSASEFKQNIEETEDRFKKTTMESSDSLEKRSWSNKMTMEKIVERPPSPPKFGPIIYNAETIKVDHTVNKIQQQSLLEKYTKEYELQKTSNKMQEQSSKDRWTGCGDLKAPSLVRNFEPPKKPTPQAYQPVPKDEIILESGPPPEFGYIPPPVSMETKIEKSKERESVRTSFRPVAPPKKEDAPMLPPKDVRITPPPLPVKQQTSLETRESFKSSVIKPTKLPPSPTPTKFVKGSFGHESDYESDFDGHLRAKWRPYESDNEEPRYRRVKPPVTKQSTRPRSTEPEPLPPSRFEVPPSSSITVQPTLLQEHGDKICKKTVIKRHEKEFKQQMGPAAPVILEPGSPPIYVQPAPKSPTGKKSDSPKFKVKSFQQESGYMADTDEPFQQKLSSMSVQKTIGKHEESCHMESKISYAETRSELIESKSYEQRKKESGLVSGVQKPTIQQQHSSSVEKSCISTAGPSQFNHAKEIFHSMDQSQKKFETTRKILPSSQSPSKFVKSEFRESDYESDYDGRIPSLWKPRSSESDKQAFRPVKSGLIGSGKQLPLSLSEHQSREFQRVQDSPSKAKTVLLPGSPPELAYAPPQTFYEARTEAPLHSAVGTESKKTVRMDESTESSRRVVTVEQTSRVIKFGEMADERRSVPKKFVWGQREQSGYESDSSKIRAKWAPANSDTEEPRYKKVRPPSPRALSVPIRQVTSSMESDVRRQTSVGSTAEEIGMENQFESRVKDQLDYEKLKPGPPPEYGFISRSDVKKAANHVASRHMTDMTSSFKSKTERFVNDIQSDLKQGRPILKHPIEGRAGDGDEPRTYKEESRLTEHGAKQIDPDTGLIYFKYDFGYEFGIVLPGDGSKKTVSNSNKKIQRRGSDIEVPIAHEFTNGRENGFATKGGRQGKFGSSKSVKWEPTSESEFSEVEESKNFRKRQERSSMPPGLLIPCSPSPCRWDHTTPSPLSLSPSLPSLSPRHSSATGPPSNVDSAGSPWPTTNGVTSSKEVIQPYLDILPKKAPIFITPLKDIAVLNGQTARFECIVQAEPRPNILWSKDNRIVENSRSYEIYYRNGVCRLTILQAYPEDAGAYACTATNNLGSTVTSATLQVPGNRRSVYTPI